MYLYTKSQVDGSISDLSHKTRSFAEKGHIQRDKNNHRRPRLVFYKTGQIHHCQVRMGTGNNLQNKRSVI